MRAGYLVRTHSDSTHPDRIPDNPERAAAALASGAQLISTDYAAPGHPSGFVFDIPDGTPARCNPVDAPPECQPSDVEER